MNKKLYQQPHTDITPTEVAQAVMLTLSQNGQNVGGAMYEGADEEITNPWEVL